MVYIVTEIKLRENKEIEEEIKQQFAERIDNAISILSNDSKINLEEFIENLKNDICFWDSNNIIYRNYLFPLKTKSIEEVIEGLDIIRKNYLMNGNPFFNKWTHLS